jgi:hypothetical protein
MSDATSRDELAEMDRQLAELDAQGQSIHAQLTQVRTASVTGSSATTQSVPEWWTNQNAMTISTVVLTFGLLVIMICAWLMRSGRQSSEAILRVFGTVLIITGSLFLVVAGYTDKQMAPVMGLLGTLAGYLLGKSPGGSESEAQPKRSS